MIDKSELERICGEPFDVISEITLKSFCYINFAGKTKKINIKIGTEYGKNNDVTENQVNQLKHFFENKNEYFLKAKTEIEKYVNLDKENGNDYIPKKIPSDFTVFTDLRTVRITSDESDSPTRLCLLFDYKYDETGICVMFRDGEIIETGSQDLLVC